VSVELNIPALSVKSTAIHSLPRNLKWTCSRRKWPHDFAAAAHRLSVVPDIVSRAENGLRSGVYNLGRHGHIQGEIVSGVSTLCEMHFQWLKFPMPRPSSFDARQDRLSDNPRSAKYASEVDGPTWPEWP
jgi:hypothetical protein